MKAYKNIILVVALVFAAGAGGGDSSVSTFTDTRDGKVYRIVQIGRQIWFAENLNYAAEGSKCYENSEDSCAKYGRLYDWETALKACPAGYHLPSDDEWTALVNYAGGEKNAEKKLTSKAGWNNNGNGTDDYGWSALPGGYDGGYSILGGRAGELGFWWSATERGAKYAWYRNMDYLIDNVIENLRDTAYLYSVRCVAD
jgi:uncharacterized protein (TIGR02145 family)